MTLLLMTIIVELRANILYYANSFYCDYEYVPIIIDIRQYYYQLFIIIVIFVIFFLEDEEGIAL